MDLTAVAGVTLASYAVAWLAGVPWLVPVLNAAAAYPFMARALLSGATRRALLRMLVWAATMGACATTLACRRPADTARLFVNADAYRTEMFGWVATGAGREGSPRQFLPQHGIQAIAFTALSAASAGTLSMPMGAVLVNQMGHYAGSLAARSPSPARTIALAWHPWSIVRIASFVTLGVLLSGPLLGRLARVPFTLSRHRALAGVALAGLAVDAVLKWLLAPVWQPLLKAAAGW